MIQRRRVLRFSFAIDEGPLYRFREVSVACNVPGMDCDKLRALPTAHPGALFDGNALDKTTELLAIEMAKLGYPFAQATPRLTHDAATQRIDVAFVIEQGPRTYVERIEIHGNTRTRDYVIRREFDIAEGDAYNKTLIDRAERRLKNLNYFKTVKISNRPGSAPDHVILDVEAVDQATGDFNVAGGYSTTDGALVEVKVGERNFYGTGKNVQAAFTFGQYARGIDLAASEPYFLGTKVAAGIELFGRQNDANSYQSYGSTTYGARLQLGTPINEQIGVQWRYSIYNQNITLSPNSFGPDAFAGRPAGGRRRSDLGLRPRQHDDLQHAGQYKEPDQRDQVAAQPGSGGTWRRRKISEDHGRRALLQIAQQRSGWHGSRPGRLRHRLGRPAGAADEQFLRRPDHGAWICPQRIRPTRPDAGHHDG